MAEETTFETLYAALEEHARKLEEGGLPLEESVATYEKGAAIAGQLRELLQKAEARIRELDVKLQAEEWALSDDPGEYDAEGLAEKMIGADFDGDD